MVVVARDDTVAPNRVTEPVKPDEETLGVNRNSTGIATDINVVRRPMIRAISVVVVVISAMIIRPVGMPMVIAAPVTGTSFRIDGTEKAESDGRKSDGDGFHKICRV